LNNNLNYYKHEENSHASLFLRENVPNAGCVWTIRRMSYYPQIFHEPYLFRFFYIHCLFVLSGKTLHAFNILYIHGAKWSVFMDTFCLPQSWMIQSVFHSRHFKETLHALYIIYRRSKVECFCGHFLSVGVKNFPVCFIFSIMIYFIPFYNQLHIG
jgi:hypothetical protein